MNELLSNASPYIRVAHDFPVDPDARFWPARIIDHALHYFKKGEGTYMIGANAIPIKPGALFLVRPGVLFSFRAHPGSRLHMLNLHFDVIEAADSQAVDWPYPKQGDSPREPQTYCLPDKDTGGPGLPSHFYLVETAAYEQLFYKILNRFGKKDTVSILQSKAALLELLAFLWRQSELKRPGAVAGGGRNQAESAVAYMQHHLNEPMTLERLAEATHMSKSYLMRCFRSTYGMSPMKFLARQRIEKAKWELLYTSKPIKQIAVETGFDGIHSFYHAFRREAGSAPGLYRANAETLSSLSGEGDAR